MCNVHKKRNIAVALLLLLTVLCGCGAKPTPVETVPPAPAATETPTPATPVPKPSPTPEPTPEPRVPRVEDAYFADAAFFGNSLVDGLHSFGGLDCGDFIACTSASVISVESTKDARLSTGEAATMLEVLLEKQYGKIYVLLGINELGFNTAGFIDLYTELLETIQEGEPDAKIFVMSLTPITERRSASETLFTKERVQEFNAAILDMTERQGYTYLDLFDAFSDENGWLPQKHSTDGVHFTADTYLDWAEYLRLNYDGAAAAVCFYRDPAQECAELFLADEGKSD